MHIFFHNYKQKEATTYLNLMAAVTTPTRGAVLGWAAPMVTRNNDDKVMVVWQNAAMSWQGERVCKTEREGGKGFGVLIYEWYNIDFFKKTNVN